MRCGASRIPVRSLSIAPVQAFSMKNCAIYIGKNDEDDRAAEWPGPEPQTTTRAMWVATSRPRPGNSNSEQLRRWRRRRWDAEEPRSPSVDLYASTKAHRTIVETLK